MQDLRLANHNRVDSMVRLNNQDRLKGSLSNGKLNEAIESNYTLGTGGVKTATLNAGNYTIDVIRRSHQPNLSQHESAKFLSGSEHHLSPEPRFNSNFDNARKSNDSRKIVSISLAPELLDAFN